MNNRNYSLDALRAIMMLLGIVVHAGITYTSLDVFPIPIKDNDTSLCYDFVILFIHAFRMPVFFVLSGFFLALLCNKKGIKNTMINRIYRIAFPFIAAMLIIAPIVKMLVMHYARGKEWADILDSVRTLKIYIHLNMGHLWFLYYLMMIYAICLFIIWIKPKPVRYLFSQIQKIISINGKADYKTILLFTLFSACFIIPQQKGFIDTSIDFVPDVWILCTYLVNFVFGYMLFSFKDNLVGVFSNWKIHLTIAFLLSFVYFFSFLHAINLTLISVECTLLSWLMIFGLMGFFLHKLNQPSTTLSLIGKSSYWVYLTHLPLTILLGGILLAYPIPHFIKFTLTVIVTYFVLISTYKLFVAQTFIGHFLNGKK